MLTCGFAHAQTNTPLSGSYGVLIHQSFATSIGQKGFVVVGVLNLDGAGNATGQFAFQNGANSSHPAQTRSVTLAGTYSTNPDGTGSLTLGVEGDLTFTFAMVITEGGQSLQLAATKCNMGANSCGSDPIVTTGSGRATKGGASTLNGTYGFLSNTVPVPASIVGVMAFDGAGNATMSFTHVGIPNNDPSGALPTASATWSGTYSINPDGTGTITFTPPPDQSPEVTVAFVATDGGSRLLLLQTGAGLDSNVSFGTARLQ